MYSLFMQIVIFSLKVCSSSICEEEDVSEDSGDDNYKERSADANSACEGYFDKV